MATFTTRQTTVTRHEWVIPAAEPWGADWVQVFRAFHNAEREYRIHHGMPTEAPDAGKLRELSDDAIRFHVGDDEIVISFETEEPAAPAPWRCGDETCGEPMRHMTGSPICRGSK